MHCDYTAQTGSSLLNIHGDFDFLPFHRMYIEGMEDFLLKQGYPQFVPLPKWDQSTCLPTELRLIDPVCSSIVATDCGNTGVNCSSSINWCPNNPRPYYLNLPVQTGTANDLCDWNMNPLVPPTSGGHNSACSTCNNSAPNGLSRVIEGGLFSGEISVLGSNNTHYYNSGHTSMGGAMNTFTSPVVLGFWLWHAHIDDVWKEWEQNCPQSSALPVDLYMKDNHKVMESWRDRGEEPSFDPNNLIYLSQDIWLRKNPDGFANHVSEEPEWESGQPFFVYVRVRNRGYQASLGTEQIHLHWAKANTGLNWPSNWDGTTFVSGVLMGDLIGAQTITSPIVAGGQQILEFVWNNPPNPDDYATINSDPWHFCLLERVDAANDPMAVAETNNLADNVKNNNNIAWKNTRILNNIPGIITEGDNCHKDIMQGIGAAVAVSNPNDITGTFDIVFKTPHEVEHCDEEGCAHEHCTVEAMSHDFTDDPGFHHHVLVKNPGIPITKEGTVLIAFNEQLYDKWVQGGKKGTGFKEVLSPPMSTGGVNNNNINANSPIVISDRRMFEITSDPATFSNITLDAHELHTTTMMVLYPTDPVSDKQVFKYDIIQNESATGEFIGAVRYDIDKPSCSDKKVNAGNDQTIDKGCSVTLTATPDAQCGNFWWLDQNGNLVAKSPVITVSPNKTTTYTVKTVTPEGCLSEDQVTINVTNKQCIKKERIIKEMSPNPADDFVTIRYKAENTSNAEIRLIKLDNSIHRTYPLNLQTDEITINVSDCTLGVYAIVLVCDGVNEDSKTLVIH